MKLNFDINKVPTPCYVVDVRLIRDNLEILKEIKERTGCKILLAQKAFSMFSLYPLIAQYLDGTAASGLHEAMLGHKYFKKENHVFSAAYSQAELDGVLPICSHVVFNSFSQWDKYKKKALEAGVSCGIRANPEHSTQQDAIYDPCSPGSRLGVTAKHFRFDDLDGIEGLHFHTLCQQNSDALVETLQVVEEKFSTCFDKLKWINMGGGHHITREDYDVNALVDCIKSFRKKYPHLEVYLEPGEAIALNAGFLCATVLDIVKNETYIAILDTSAACHMPDVLEMPYRPRVIGSGERGEKAYSYTLAGSTCLAGDIIGEYSFDKPLAPDDILVFEDMAIYSMVKNNTFNGINLPSIAICSEGGCIKVVKYFGYDEFEVRLS